MRIARGLEPDLVDNEHVTIAALEPGDLRTFELRVAGPAALPPANRHQEQRATQAAETHNLTG
jgi:hypothetical protein